uniref:Phage protein n=1 Tax=Meloidogyne hapla TaxID=6305 RepID=A0A1I8BUE8_MELHA
MYNLKLKYNNNDIKGAIHLLKEEKAKLENNLIDVKKIVQKNGGFFRMLTYKTKSVKKINQAEIMLDQFTVYEDLDFETAIMESNEAVDPKKLVN